MHALDVIKTLHARGVTLHADGDNLRIKGVSRITSAEPATHKAHKAALLSTLHQQEPAVQEVQL